MTEELLSKGFVPGTGLISGLIAIALSILVPLTSFPIIGVAILPLTFPLEALSNFFITIGL